MKTEASDFEAVMIIPAAGGEVTLNPAVAELGLHKDPNSAPEPKRFKRLREEREAQKREMKEAS